VKLGDIEITPIASESMGVRSLCTHVKTPDISILLDPSAALAYRKPHDPHPEEYRALAESHRRIKQYAESSDILSISHYHFDHVISGLLDWHYKFSSREKLQEIYGGHRIFAKDSRENINASQRRRAFYFEKDLRELSEIEWSDGKSYSFGNTTITYSHPLPHGPDDSRLGTVLATSVEYDEKCFVFAPDVQGPVSRKTLRYLLSLNANVMIVGGPPLYLRKFSQREIQDALYGLTTLAFSTEYLVVDHHLLRSHEWRDWIGPIANAAKTSSHIVFTMAELQNAIPQFLEAERETVYNLQPPGEEFVTWLAATEEFKQQNRPPI
jgi:predicted metallo-beta-lactamase superfamily hydrolase